MKLTTKFALLLVVTMILLSGLIYAGFETQREQIVQHQQAETTQVAESVVARVDYQVDEKKRNVRIGANEPALGKFGTDEQEQALTRFAESTDFYTVALLDDQGVKQDFRGVPEEVRQDLIGTDYSDRPYYQRAIEGEVYVTDPFVADTGDQIAVISAPVRDEDGEIVGVLGGSVVLNDGNFFEWVQQYDTPKQSVVVTGPEDPLYDKNQSFEDPMTATATAESAGWTVTVDRSRTPISREIRTEVGSFVLHGVGMIGVVLLVLGVFGGWVYSTNLRQARRLLDGFEAVERGEYDHDPGLGGSEEWDSIDDGFADLRESLESRERQLREERDRFATLFENVPDPAVLYRFDDDEPVVERVNSEFDDIFEDEGLEGRPLSDLLVPADGTSADVTSLVASDERTHREIRLETRSDLRDFVVQNAPLAATNDRRGGCLICTDITDQKHRERELQRQNERLDRFASVVSHDLRNPLEIALGYIEAIENADEDGDHRRNAEYVREALERMESMIDSLLTLAREGQAVGETEQVALSSVVDQGWRGVETDGIDLKCDLNRTVVEADPDRLQTLFENLFRNAVEHGSTSNRPEAGDSVEHAGEGERVEVGTTGDGFYVADDGPGIPPEDRESVFEFGHSGGGGTGFGLAIVDSIAEAHGWEVQATEGSAGGARFEVTGVEMDP